MVRRTVEVRLDVLLRTACSVIAERGLANTRTADVAAAAGVSQALVFYHFHSKHQLLARAFAYAAEQDLARVDAVLRSPASPVGKVRRIIRLYLPSGTPKSWELWLDGWAESMRMPELERVTRALDLRWHDALAEVIAAGVDEGALDCADPAGAAWRIIGLADGLAVQVTVHERMISRRQVGEWVRLAAAQELGIKPDQLA